MIYFEVSQTRRAKHRSGLTRVSAKLMGAFGAGATPVALFEHGQGMREDAGFKPQRDDWLLVADLFSETEYPGLTSFMRSRPCRLAAVFHDAIPLKYPHITWPRSVARHPEYMKLLASFDRVFAVSEASRRELIDYWRWLGIEAHADVQTMTHGADFAGGERVCAPATSTASLLCIGILEPRKNQSFLLDVCDALWDDGLRFDLHVVGRVNPHFGKPVVSKLRSLSRRRPGLRFHEAASDERVVALYCGARATVFPTIAEGCGLPLLESLWMGVPCVCSDLPVLNEQSAAGGCIAVAVNDVAAWKNALKRLLTDDAFADALRAQARARTLPTWDAAAASLVQRLT